MSNKVRVKPLRVILNGLGKDAAYIISRINGFTYVETKFDPATEEVKVLEEKQVELDTKQRDLLLRTPNTPDETTPIGQSEEDNPTISTFLNVNRSPSGTKV